MLSNFDLVQNVHLNCSDNDLARLTVYGQRGQIDKSALRTFLGKQLLREVLLRFHSVKPDLLDEIQPYIVWRISLLEHPFRISFSYWVAGKEGKQARRFRILFKSERVPKLGYLLTVQSFRRGDEA